MTLFVAEITEFGGGGLGEIAEFVVDGAENGTGHFHEWPGEKERESLDGDTDENPKEIVAGGFDKNPTSKVRGTEESGEERVKNEHTDKEVAPFIKEFFSVR